MVRYFVQFKDHCCFSGGMVHEITNWNEAYDRDVIKWGREYVKPEILG